MRVYVIMRTNKKTHAHKIYCVRADFNLLFFKSKLFFQFFEFFLESLYLLLHGVNKAITLLA